MGCGRLHEDDGAPGPHGSPFARTAVELPPSPPVGATARPLLAGQLVGRLHVHGHV
jgi:hypothetical protein